MPAPDPATDALPREIDPKEVAQLRESDVSVVLVDCRTPPERATAVIGPSLFAPMTDLGECVDELRDAANTCDRLVIYCHHGVRSLRVTDELRTAGIDRVQSMRGGIDQWSLEIDPAITRY